MFHVYLWLYWGVEHHAEVILALLVAIIAPKPILRALGSFEHLLRRCGNRRRLAIAVVFLSAIVTRVALLPVAPVPVPKIHDEFSYLLAADTFANLRLTNPTHPMWVHLETFHVNQQPTYHSMYPPAQGLVMGVAQAITGLPWIGVLFSVAAMCAAVCWMLQGWMPPGWAFFGGLMAVAHYAAAHYWVDSYWGGAVAATGGALLLGALPRIQRSPKARYGVILASGLAILANSRPYEGLMLAIPAMLWLLVWLIRRRRPGRLIFMRVLLPAAAVLAIAASAMMFYFWRTTRDPLRMPYQVNMAAYQTTPPLLVGDGIRPTPAYRYKIMRDLYVRHLEPYWPKQKTWPALRDASMEKLLFYYGDFVQPLSVVFALGLLFLLVGRRFALLFTFLFFTAGILINTFWYQHYAAPATAVVIAILVFGLRYVRVWQRQAKIGLRWSRAMMLIPLVLLATSIWRTADTAVNPRFPESWQNARARVASQLEKSPGKHLVMVRYGPKHSMHFEWVFNSADIDNSKIVWARESSWDNDRELLEFFRGRKVWLVDVDTQAPRPQAYYPRVSDQVVAGRHHPLTAPAGLLRASMR